ncbi:type IV secretory system conjugative DNA transfer family protein [Mycoplasma zalophidermidis]|uniref:Type IV secretory system conjugative DNA transfer family protein n=1 Tax=Mycoplasma zalophidermidis TaxID=398174 RepID=A0ABS6DSN9_9MOLU|nr:type IV secretory system conjugative DNA transfer family protein [Mycoplasma zalophidermidis]MBU4693439.1 type IV secretory system conjugative DNA transfer family protein [Mycoplasma zalophidermidis]
MKKHKKLFNICKYIFSLVIVPIALFFVLGIFGQIYYFKYQIIQDWFNHRRNLLKDVMSFYSRDNGWIFILVILVVSLVVLVWIKYHDWLKAFQKQMKGSETSAYLWNENTHQGSLKKLKKEFANDDEVGFVIGHIKKHGTLVNHTDAHMILLGIAGSGKTWRILFENIRRNASLPENKKPNLVITDPKGELLQATGGILKENGYDIKLFDFDDMYNSVYWNPLKTVWDCLHRDRELVINDYYDAINRINEIVENLPYGDEKNSIWVSQAKNCIKLVIKFMAFYSVINSEFKLDYFTLENTYTFLNIDMFTKGLWRKEIKQNSNINKLWNDIYTEMEALANTTPETLSGFLTNAQNALGLFKTSPIIQKITSGNNVDFIDMFNNNKPFAIFIKFPDHKKANSFLIPILISQIYEQAISKANENKDLRLERTLLFILEEFASIQNLKNIADWMSISRSRKIFFALTLQDYTQLDKYNTGANENKLIKSQARLTVFLETNNQETLRDISEMMGESKVERTSTTSSDKGTSTTRSVQSEKTMSVSQLKFKSKKDALILSGGYKPILIKPLFAFDYTNIDKSYRHREPQEVRNHDKAFDFLKLKPINYEADVSGTNSLPSSNSGITKTISLGPKNIEVEPKPDKKDALSIDSKSQPINQTLERFRKTKFSKDNKSSKTK